MTSGLVALQRLELRMTYVRGFAVLFGVLAVAIQPSYPDDATRLSAWFLIVAIALGTLVIWGASARTDDEATHIRLSLAGFAFDAVLISAFVWTYAYERPYVTWALLFLIPLEGALRLQMKGALLSAAYIGLFFIPQTFRRADLLDTGLDISTYAFVVCLASLIAAVTGAMANQWRHQSEALEEQSLKLAEVDQLKDRFLAITSHEIRGPLTAIIAGVDTIRKRSSRLTPEQHDRLLEMIALQGEQLARLVDDLSITSQIQSGQLALQTEWADLDQTVTQALQAAASKRKQHQLEVFVEPVQADMDAARVGQIVRNLVENAYKYTPDRTRVSVTARSSGKGLEIKIADEGPGIPADKRGQLFEAFSRIEETAAGREGVGLGLYVVSQLIAAMKGRIDLQSSTRGTTFTITIPCEVKSAGSPRLGLVTSSEGEASG
jgi:signal transduction histidine kinase